MPICVADLVGHDVAEPTHDRRVVCHGDALDAVEEDDVGCLIRFRLWSKSSRRCEAESSARLRLRVVR